VSRPFQLLPETVTDLRYIEQERKRAEQSNPTDHLGFGGQVVQSLALGVP